MDKRLKQVEEKKEDAALVEVGEDKYIIKVDKVSTDNAYKESVIYNLVQKLSYLDEMKRGYNDALEKVETYPPWIKYYVHLQCRHFDSMNNIKQLFRPRASHFYIAGIHEVQKRFSLI